MPSFSPVLVDSPSESWCHMQWKLCSEFFMGLCFSCRKSRLNSVKSEYFSASVTPLHVCVEEQRGPELGSSSKEICQYSSYIRMANTMSNMKMTNPIKGLVSKRRKRYTQDGFNLDLTCILCLHFPVTFFVVAVTLVKFDPHKLHFFVQFFI